MQFVRRTANTLHGDHSVGTPLGDDDSIRSVDRRGVLEFGTRNDVRAEGMETGVAGASVEYVEARRLALRRNRQRPIAVESFASSNKPIAAVISRLSRSPSISGTEIGSPTR